MTRKIFRQSDVPEKQVGDNSVGITIVKEYFSQVTPNLGLATATINGKYPPDKASVWAINEQVDEIYYVLEGTAKIIYQDGDEFEMKPGYAAYIPCGLKYRVEKANGLRVAISTGPAWLPDQHKWSKD